MFFSNQALEKPAKPSESSWAFLALVRFGLAMAVFIGHFALMVDKARLNLFGFGFFAAASAVYGFFILSGYSIAASLDSKSSGFYSRRFIRIWPLYLSALIFGLLVVAVLPSPFKLPLDENFKEPVTWLSVLASFLMLQDIVAPAFWICGVIWSLSPEWWWYMIAPLLKRVWVLFLFALMALSLVQFIQWNWGFNFMWYLHSRENNMHAFNIAAWNQESFGSAITGLFWLWIAGFLYYRYRRTPHGFCVLAFPCVLAFMFGRSVGFPCFATIFALVLCEEFKFSEKIGKFFDFLGDLSYPIYLFHVAVMALMVFLGFQGLFVYAIGVLGVSVASLYLVDFPARKIFARYKARGTIVPAAQS